ncbi:hypothetical protein [Sphaerisporangium krabiense]|uniref:Uncharacterized protein n=1 Tax=Sphaerisporangium krabiense TaxID=763782 RepID=A0A7W9DS19_9ACTN|nr:hypothetical protein [Sphaerisporangium krabiense]MBB5627955.1 hypothetical protein [Sphaerisporangium krabiense]
MTKFWVTLSREVTPYNTVDTERAQRRALEDTVARERRERRSLIDDLRCLTRATHAARRTGRKTTPEHERPWGRPVQNVLPRLPSLWAGLGRGLYIRAGHGPSCVGHALPARAAAQ